MPSIDHVAMLQAYGSAFGTLLWLLTAITAATAVVVFLYLGKSAEKVESAPDETDLVPGTITDP
ncbi:hypothetical protein [Ensifer canadensis]